MTRYFDFALDRPGLGGVRILVCRPALPEAGDIEDAFLDGLTAPLGRHAPGTTCAEALRRVANGSCQVVAVVRNPGLVLDGGLPDRIAAALERLPAPDTWSIAGAGGLGLHDRRHLAIYASASPAIPLGASMQPLLDVMPDLFIVNAAFARRTLAAPMVIPDAAFETTLVVEGYLAGRAALFLPGLTAGIDGAFLARDLEVLDTALQDRFAGRLPGQVLPTLAGDVTLGRADADNPPPDIVFETAVRETLETMPPPITLSVIVRTQFTRAHLLERLLTSLSRARIDAVVLEVVLSTDAPPCLSEAELARLSASFGNLDIRLQRNEAIRHSRVDNLIGGLRAARHDYSVFIDDDDYLDLFAFEQIRLARFGGALPLIVTGTELHAEEWQSTPSGRWVLSASRPHGEHPASGWRDMFTGVNRLPVCALIFPRKRLLARLAAHDIAHDLSEDYALFLLALTDPELPEILDLPGTFCHVSIRGHENSVTMPDRRPWARDIAAQLADLTANRAVAGPGTWQLLARAAPETEAAQASVADLRTALDRARAELALARREARRLRALAHTASEAPA